MTNNLHSFAAEVIAVSVRRPLAIESAAPSLVAPSATVTEIDDNGDVSVTSITAATSQKDMTKKSRGVSVFQSITFFVFDAICSSWNLRQLS